MGGGHGSVPGRGKPRHRPLAVEAGEANTDATATVSAKQTPGARAQLGALLSGGHIAWPRGPCVGTARPDSRPGETRGPLHRGAPGNTEPHG